MSFRILRCGGIVLLTYKIEKITFLSSIRQKKLDLGVMCISLQRYKKNGNQHTRFDKKTDIALK